MNTKKDYSISTGNIFADLGFPDAEERMAKVNLALQINVLIKCKKLTQKQAAELLDIDQPKISALSTGKLSGFSLERLFRFLTILGQDIIINITPKA
jgi:predicted XRE-type DNA-binding protein